jgi:hypothetical protein
MINDHVISNAWCNGYNDGFDTGEGQLGICFVGVSFSFDEGKGSYMSSKLIWYDIARSRNGSKRVP